MNVLAIDGGTHCGFALARDGQLLESGTEDFSLRRGESPGARYLRFRAWLARIQQTWPIGLVVFEQAHHRGGAATEIGVGFTTRCQEFAAEYGAECVAIHSATAKKFGAGTGRADKPMMIAAAKRLWPTTNPADDNEADALVILSLALRDYGGK